MLLYDFRLIRRRGIANGELNHENLNRCFIVAIDESEEQTRLIHHNQRIKYTLEGHLNKKELNKIREKHIYAQRLLKKIHVFNPYATLLTFPSQRLQTRRDNEKLLKLINSSFYECNKLILQIK